MCNIVWQLVARQGSPAQHTAFHHSGPRQGLRCTRGCKYGTNTMIALYLDTAEAELHDGPLLLAGAGFDVRHAIATTPSEAAAAAEGATAILLGDSPLTAEVLQALPDLRIVSTVTVGTDQVDVAAAAAREIVVANVPDAVTEEVAVTTLALILGLARHTHLLDRSVRSGGWDPFAAGPRHRLSEQTLGLVGLGRIGRRVAQLAAPFFGEIIACDPVAAIPLPLRRVELSQLLASSDFVSLHLPAAADQAPIIDAAALRQMRPGAYLVNVARGTLVVTDDLIDALDRGVIAGAALDVAAEEPPAASSPLRSHPRIVTNPHGAFWSLEAEAQAYRHQARNVIAWSESGKAITPVC